MVVDHRIDLFAKFGGVRAMARTLGLPKSTVASWKSARRIPAGNAQELVLRCAEELGLDVLAEDVMFPFPEDREAR